MSCIPEEFCGNANVTSYTIDWEAEESLHNWVQKLDLTCESKEKIGMLGSAWFILWIPASLIVPRLADLYGRIWFFRIGMVIMLAAYTVVMFTRNLTVMICAIAIIGACNTVRLNVGFIVMFEYLHSDKHALIGSSVWIWETSCSIAGVAYFTWFSKDWFWYVFVGYIFQIWATIGSFLIPETPKYLMKSGQRDVFEAAMKNIAKVNRKPDAFENEQFDDIVDDTAISTGVAMEQESFITNEDGTQVPRLLTKGKKAEFKAMYFLKQRTILVNLIVMAIVWLTWSFNYFLLNFQM